MGLFKQRVNKSVTFDYNNIFMNLSLMFWYYLGKRALKEVESELRARLQAWQRATGDPWLCAPAGVLERGLCMDLGLGLGLDVYA